MIGACPLPPTHRCPEAAEKSRVAGLWCHDRHRHRDSMATGRRLVKGGHKEECMGTRMGHFEHSRANGKGLAPFTCEGKLKLPRGTQGRRVLLSSGPDPGVLDLPLPLTGASGAPPHTGLGVRDQLSRTPGTPSPPWKPWDGRVKEGPATPRPRSAHRFRGLLFLPLCGATPPPRSHWPRHRVPAHRTRRSGRTSKATPRTPIGFWRLGSTQRGRGPRTCGKTTRAGWRSRRDVACPR